MRPIIFFIVNSSIIISYISLAAKYIYEAQDNLVSIFFLQLKMGHWDEGIFGGDGGCDFFGHLSDKTGEESLNYLVENLATPETYVEIEEADAIIIISYIVIGFVDREYIKNTPKEVVNDYFKGKVEAYLDKNQGLWLGRYVLKKYGDDQDLTIYQYVSNAIDGVLDPENSEAVELWSENADSFDQWKSYRQQIQQEVKKLDK